MNGLELEARAENLPKVLAFVDGELEQRDCPMKTQMQIDIAVEELFVNIANYAYHPEIGWASVMVEVLDDPLSVSVTFMDSGEPYDPLAKADPDYDVYEQTLCTSVMCAESGVYYFAPAWNRRISAIRLPAQGSEMQYFDLGNGQDIDWRN